MALSRSQKARLAAGSLIGAFALWLAFRGTDSVDLRLALSEVQPLWVGLAVLSVGATVAMSVVRWRLLFYPDHRSRSWRTLTAGVVIGQMVNTMLPLRLGEVARAFLVGRQEQLPTSRVLATIAVEKLADLVSAGLAAGVLLAMLSTPDWLRAPGRALMILGGIAAIAVVVLATRAESMLRVTLQLVGLVRPSWRERVRRSLEPGLVGLVALESWRVSLLVWTMTIAVLLLAASTNYLLFRAFELALPAAAALTLLVALQVGNSLVSVPGNLGVFHYVTVLVLAAYAVDRNVALGYAFVLYAVVLVPKIGLAALFLMMGYGWSTQSEQN